MYATCDLFLRIHCILKFYVWKNNNSVRVFRLQALVRKLKVAQIS